MANNQDKSAGNKFFSQEGNTAQASIKVEETVMSRARPGDIHKKDDSEGMCVEE